MTKIFIIGYGNMGQSIARLLCEIAHKSTTVASLNQTSPYKITICDRHSNQEMAPFLKAFPGTQYISSREIDDTDSSSFSFDSEDVVLLAFKPHNLEFALTQWVKIFEGNKNNPLVVSILAGTPISAIQKILGSTYPVVRAMTNIAAKIGVAATTITPSASVSQKQLEIALTLFGHLGRCWEVPENLIDTVTGLSGSGPAYIYMVIEALSDGGVKMGMPRKLALDLAAQTVLGAAELVIRTGEHPAVLRDQVTTPGGTTIDAIHELEKHGLRSMLISAVATATEKSRKLRSIE